MEGINTYVYVTLYLCVCMLCVGLSVTTPQVLRATLTRLFATYYLYFFVIGLTI